MRALPCLVLGGALLGSAFGQVYSATLHVRYGEPTQEVFTVRPGYNMTVVYGSEHQACRFDISSGQSDSFESSKRTNQVLDEIVEELVPETTRGPVKDDGIMFTGFGGQRITTYEFLTITHTELLSPSTGVLRTVVTFKHNGCNGVTEPKQRASQ